MEFEFEKSLCSCLDVPVQEVQSIELTQELRLTDGMPDMGRVIGCWGQVILRGKEWHTDTAAMSGGVMVWVLYAPEDGTGIRCVDSWIPFQIQWDLPEDTPEGALRVWCRCRFADARSISAKKAMVRVGISALSQVLVPKEAEVYDSGEVPAGVQQKKNQYPVRLLRETGEKAIILDEALTLPASLPQPEKLICYRADANLTEKRVLADKVIFRGDTVLRMLYLSEEGQLHSWDFTLPFSQFAQMKDACSTEAEADIAMAVTNLELTMDQEGSLRLKGGLLAQYLVSDTKLLELTEDAYIPGRELAIKDQELKLPFVLEERLENPVVQVNVRADANMVVDAWSLPDFAKLRQTAGKINLELPGTIQVLYYGEDGSLHSASTRWEHMLQLEADEDSHFLAIPMNPGEPQVNLGAGNMAFRMELPVEVCVASDRGIPMVTGFRMGEEKKPDPNRPSLILCRVGDLSVWEIAKAAGSTVDGIRKANGFSEEPEKGSMLLIPIQ